MDSLPRSLYANLVGVPYRSDACVDLMARLWAAWRETGIREYRLASEMTWQYARANIRGLNVEAILREANPDRWYDDPPDGTE